MSTIAQYLIRAAIWAAGNPAVLAFTHKLWSIEVRRILNRAANQGLITTEQYAALSAKFDAPESHV